jgi:hypothetical protein
MWSIEEGPAVDVKTDPDSIPLFLSPDRLASLSDTMFGVAMTLFATTLVPYVETYKGSPLDMLSDKSGHLGAVVLRFARSIRHCWTRMVSCIRFCPGGSGLRLLYGVSRYRPISRGS